MTPGAALVGVFVAAVITLFNVGVALAILGGVGLVYVLWRLWDTVNGFDTALTSHAESIQALETKMSEVDELLRADEV